MPDVISPPAAAFRHDMLISFLLHADAAYAFFRLTPFFLLDFRQLALIAYAAPSDIA